MARLTRSREGVHRGGEVLALLAAGAILVGLVGRLCHAAPTSGAQSWPSAEHGPLTEAAWPTASAYQPAWLLARASQSTSTGRLAPIWRASSTAARVPEPTVLALLAAVDFDRCQRDLRRLTGMERLCAGSRCGTIGNRLTGGPGLELALDYFLEELGRLGYEPQIEAWQGRQVADRNVLVRKTGVVSPTEEVFVVAHVDGVGSCPGPVCPAADDNGSGAVATLELARVFAGTSFARSVVLLFTTGEEQGMVGAQAFIARRSREELRAIHGLINVDMLGYDGNGDNVVELYYGEHPPSVELAQRIRQAIETYVPALRPRPDPGCG